MYKNNNQIKTTYTGLGMAVGLVFGALIDLLTGHIVIFTGGCMILGFIIGSALDNRSRNKKG